MNSNARVTKLLASLINGEILETTSICAQYDISKRTLQRDLAAIKDALGPRFELIEDHGTWKLATIAGERRDLVMTIANILLGSRGLAIEDLTACLNWLLSQLDSSDRDLAENQLRIARADYLPMTEAKPLLAMLRTIEDAISKSLLLTFSYNSSGASDATDHLIQAPKRGPRENKHAQPVAVFFEEHYWYVAMYEPEKAHFWVYRMDRIQQIIASEPGLDLEYAKRFSLQDHRHRTYLLSSGEFITFTFEYSEHPPTALDKFPQSTIIKHNPDGTVVIRAHAYLSGAALWLMGQGPAVKVLEPPSLIALLKAKHQAAIQRYQ